jgi:hypothetical protein
MTPYNSEFSPPAPVIAVGISAVGRPDNRFNLLALLDTAADISVLPDTLVDLLELEPTAETFVAGFENQPQRVAVYAVAVHIAGARLYPARFVTHIV